MNNKTSKILIKVLIIETLLFIFLLMISISLYFSYDNTKNTIESIIKIISNFIMKIIDITNIVLSFFTGIYKALNLIFNNREVAIAFWIIIFIIFALLKKEIRKQIPNLIRTAFCKQLIIWYISMIAYFIVLIFALYKIGFWNIDLLKDTIIWFLTVGVISSGKAINKAKNFKYFKEFIKDNVKGLVIIQFILNLYTFTIIWEIIQVFLITIISMLIAFIEIRPEYQNKSGKSTRKFLNSILTILGINIIFHSVISIYKNFNEIEVLANIRLFLLPLLLSLFFVIYIYLLVVYSAYEQVFIRLGFKKTIDDKVRPFLKCKILLFCNLNLKRINSFIKRSRILNSHVRNKDDVKTLFKEYKCNKHQTNSEG